MKHAQSLKSIILSFASIIISGCTAAGLGIANIPAKQSDQYDVAEISYGAHSVQKADIYRPTQPQRDGKPYPVLLFFYGGSWDTGSKDQYAFFAKHYAEQGYIVIIPDYQKYPHVKFPMFVEDGALAIDWAVNNIDHYGGDPEMIIVSGHSAGAHIGALLATDQSYFERFPDSYQSIKGFVGLSGPYAFEPKARKFKEIFGPSERYPLMRAPNFVDGTEPPMLLLHGAEDGTVALENTKRFAAALAEKNVPVETVFFDHVGHMGMIAT